jgi:S-adenosylmethionine-dependent methyltransferase
MTSRAGSERFLSGAQKYAAYLETPEGRLRADLALANLQEFLPGPNADVPVRVLDIGCGTGAMAVRLAKLGFRVTAMDSSEAMLDIARAEAKGAGVGDDVALLLGNAQNMAEMLPPNSFDAVLCHNVLEYLEQPADVVRGAARVLRGTSAMLSMIVRNQVGEIFKAAIQAGDFEAAEANLTAEWGCESLYGGRVRLFNPVGVRALLQEASLTIIAERGIRVVADYLPLRISRASEYERIFALERKLGCRLECAQVARYTHCLARRIEGQA